MSLNRTDVGQGAALDSAVDNTTDRNNEPQGPLGGVSSAALAGALDEVEMLVPSLMRKHNVPGVAVGVAHAGQREIRCFGTVACNDPRPVEPTTLFSVQSVSKLFTATALMVLVERGLLDLDAPIVTYLPTFTVNSAFETRPERKMTLRHLLSHTSGLTHEAPIGSNYDLSNATFSEHCASIAGTWLRGPVGHHCEYSNLGVDLAGLIVERQTGMSFPRAARALLFDPLNLTDSTFDIGQVAVAPSRAVGHEPGFASVPLTIPMVPSGGLYTNVVDALNFAEVHRRRCSGLLSGETYEQMSAIPFPAPLQQFGYALGIHHQSRAAGIPVSGHGGNGFGFHADLVWSDQDQFDVVVLTNSGDPGIKWRIGDAIINRLGRPRQWLRLEAPNPHAGQSEMISVNGGGAGSSRGGIRTDRIDVDSFTGDYFSREGSAVVSSERRHDGVENSETVARGPRLVLRTGDQDDGLTHVAGDAFAGPRFDVEFLRGADNQVRYLRRLHDGVTFYRNLPGTGTEPGTGCRAGRPASPDDGTFSLLQWGQPVAEVTINCGSDHDGAAHLRIGWVGEMPHELTLCRVTDRVYITSTGETLDLTAPGSPTYASLPLLPVRRDHQEADV